MGHIVQFRVMNPLQKFNEVFSFIFFSQTGVKGVRSTGPMRGC